MPPAETAILVVDDEPDLRILYELTLLREGYRVETADSLAGAQALLAQQRFDVVITDMRLPDGLGLRLLQDLRAAQRPERCVVITAHGSAENAVEALRSGAFDYLTKPVNLKQLRTTIASATQRLPSRPAPSAPAPAVAAEGAAAAALARIVGHSPAIAQVRQQIARIAPSMAPVLIRGESGTGKELVARALHACSHRGTGPWVAVNCAAIPEALLEAEFFGARKGAYTGATQDRDGYFQAARGGTLFLDEVGELPLAMQAKLLRALQERSVRPLGGTQEEVLDVRVVSASHRDLAHEVQAGRFRQDLYYRLNVIDLHLPPLRERREDLPALCQALLARMAEEYSLPMRQPSAASLHFLAQHPLPGNVRELENLLHRAAALGEGPELDLAPPPPQPVATDKPNPVRTEEERAAAPGKGAPALPVAAPGEPALALPCDLQAWLDEQERQILVRALERSQFNRTAAAALLGISLRQMRYRIARLNIPTPKDTDPAP